MSQQGVSVPFADTASATSNHGSVSVERPVASSTEGPIFSSDVCAETLRSLGIDYIALNPGASFRGLHDSLVNHLGNEAPQMLMCLHEEHAVALAHGYAKVSGRLMAAAVHSNVGLFHATMAIYNAWCDRVPVLVVGATGPVDAVKRRPWIDWIHTARDQASIVRDYTKWDDQPASAGAARQSLMRAARISRTAPMGPTYVVLDADMQEEVLSEPLPEIDLARYATPVSNAASADAIEKAFRVLRGAERPLIMVGRVTRDVADWEARVALAEGLGARVVTDLKVGAGFPTAHPLHVGVPAMFASAGTLEAIREADAILSLDWVDLGGTLRSACGDAITPALIIQVSVDHHLHNGWSMDHQEMVPTDLHLAAEPDVVVRAMIDLFGPSNAADRFASGRSAVSTGEATTASEKGATSITVDDLATELRAATARRDVSLLQLPLSWSASKWPFQHPLDYIGTDGGGGIGSGPGLSVGAALALRGSGRLPVAVLGDGNFLMGVSAFWTAVHYGIPLLVVVANNKSFFNDEVHQERVARMRGRPVENKWIGQRITDPEIDIAGMARAQGAIGFGPVTDVADLPQIYAQAIEAVDAGSVVVVDIHIETGYPPGMTAALAKAGK